MSAPASLGAARGQRHPAAAPADTDLIYAVIVNELGLAGACGLLLSTWSSSARLKVAMIAQDSFSKLLATG